MAIVTQDVTPANSYTPFEGMPENVRLLNGVPRGLVRFEADIALTAKPVNDSMILNITSGLPTNFAYVLCSLSFQIQVDRATDWHTNLRFRMFNGLPAASAGNEQISVFNFEFYAPGSGVTAQRILDYSKGDIRTWYPNPLWPKRAEPMSFTLQAGNVAATVQAAGTMLFHAAFYQYDLTQALRYPLNSPLPVGIR